MNTQPDRRSKPKFERKGESRVVEDWLCSLPRSSLPACLPPPPCRGHAKPLAAVTSVAPCELLPPAPATPPQLASPLSQQSARAAREAVRPPQPPNRRRFHYLRPPPTPTVFAPPPFFPPQRLLLAALYHRCYTSAAAPPPPRFRSPRERRRVAWCTWPGLLRSPQLVLASAESEVSPPLGRSTCATASPPPAPSGALSRVPRQGSLAAGEQPRSRPAERVCAALPCFDRGRDRGDEDAIFPGVAEDQRQVKEVIVVVPGSRVTEESNLFVIPGKPRRDRHLELTGWSPDVGPTWGCFPGFG
nr:unnamed protein product [Digitaria exilis]